MEDHKHGETSFGDEQYVREGGVLVPVHTGHENRHEDGSIAPDEWVEDDIAQDNSPGTQDDLPYDYGVEVQQPVDQLVDGPDDVNAGFGRMGQTGSDEDEEEPPLGRPEERELWRKQRGLIDEAGDEEARYRGLEDADVRRIDDAVGPESGEVFPEGPEGGSATGSK